MGPKGSSRKKIQPVVEKKIKKKLTGAAGVIVWDFKRKDNMKLEKNNFVVTFKTEKEVSDYIGMHIPEEQRLLWLGFFIANNFIAERIEQDGLKLEKVQKDKQDPASWKTRR